MTASVRRRRPPATAGPRAVGAHRARAVRRASRSSASGVEATATLGHRRGHDPRRPVPRPHPRRGARLPRQPGRARAELLPAAALGRAELHPSRRLRLRDRHHSRSASASATTAWASRSRSSSLDRIEVWYSPATRARAKSRRHLAVRVVPRDRLHLAARASPGTRSASPPPPSPGRGRSTSTWSTSASASTSRSATRRRRRRSPASWPRSKARYGPVDRRQNPLAGLPALRFDPTGGLARRHEVLGAGHRHARRRLRRPGPVRAALTLDGPRAKILAGLAFEILYRRINDHLGVYHVELKLPDVLRKIEAGEADDHPARHRPGRLHQRRLPPRPRVPAQPRLLAVVLSRPHRLGRARSRSRSRRPAGSTSGCCPGSRPPRCPRSPTAASPR